jgi:hypothetical protein
MRADDLTRAQARALKNKLGPMVAYLNRLGKRKSDRNFPADDPMRVMVVAALKAMYELHAEVTCRSMDGKGLNETPKPPAVDPLFTRKSALRKDEKIRLGRIRRDTH